MGKFSEIQWTDHTWNIARGCTKVSDGCKYCYMMRDGEKFGYDAAIVTRTKTVFDMPLRIKDARSGVWPGRPLVFTSSLTDVLHRDIDPFRHEMWDIIEKCPHLIFQILTKRPQRWHQSKPANWNHGWDNVWMGISAENQECLDERMHWLEKIPARIKFLSLEPLLGPVDLTPFFKPHKTEPSGITGSWSYGGQITIDYASQGRLWVIAGGESGNDNGVWKYRRCHMQWIQHVVEQCRMAGVPVFIKQLGTHLAKEYGLPDRHGGIASQWPARATLPREFPISDL